MANAAMGPGAAAGVTLSVAPDLGARNRLTVAFRAILAIPHTLLVGSFNVGTSGVLGTVAAVCALVSWFAIVFIGRQPKGLWDLECFYLRWKVRAVSYAALLRDEYPPFGDGEYPAALSVEPPAEPRNRLTVGFRPILAIPQVIVLFFLMLAWIVTTVIAWFAILFTGRYPAGLASFGVNVMRWMARVETYVLLLRDEYPPFSLSE